MLSRKSDLSLSQTTYRTIPLNQGLTAIVDEDVYEYLTQFKWRANTYKGKKVGVCYGDKSWDKSKYLLMHREVIKFYGLKWVRVRHLNRNCLDNRLSNLAAKKTIGELCRRADAIREHFKAQAIRDYWHSSVGAASLLSPQIPDARQLEAIILQQCDRCYGAGYYHQQSIDCEDYGQEIVCKECGGVGVIIEEVLE